MDSPQGEDEFLKAYDMFAQAIFRYCFFRISNRETAQDLMQDTFLRAWRYIAKGERVQNMKAFLYKVAHNLITDEFRRRNANSVSLEALGEKGFEFQAVQGENPMEKAEIQEILALLSSLDPPHRNVVIMRYIDELSPKEIAEISGETENAVSVRLHRAIERLQKLINRNQPIL